jgi:hypothetical protein
VVAASLPVPGPSFLRPLTLRLPGRDGAPDRTVELGMSQPSTTEDGWWLGHVWAFAAGRILDTTDVAAPDHSALTAPPAVMGPPFAGALAGLVAEEGGRQQVRLRLYPPADPSQPWERPLALQVAIRWDPVRAATLRPNQLASAVLNAFARAIEAVGAVGTAR